MRVNFKTLSILALLGIAATACGVTPAVDPNQNIKTNSGATQQKATVQLNSKGRTIEQENLVRRTERDTKPGATKHLYAWSTYNNSLMLYSPVDGKVTSTTKRLTPSTVVGVEGEYVDEESKGILFDFGGQIRRTTQVMGEDGAYGESTPGIFWFTPAGEYYQMYPTGGLLTVISETQLRVPPAVIQLAPSGTAGK
ncbi:MAG: hypothetical protein IAF58_01430 [Leptolyngbya sp.]|nr:hypothetical protein [Candidatus Melainabacteria bacterium]